MQIEPLNLPAFETLSITPSMRRDLRSDHAGETGAVYIYRGILQHTDCPELVDFARAHLKTEIAHLRILKDWLPSSCKSKLLTLWRHCGWLLGTIAAKLGREFTFATIVAVEKFVVAHYQAQIVQASGVVRALLLTRGLHAPWATVVRAASASAVLLARRV